MKTLTGHALNVWSVKFSADGRWLASGSFDHTAKLWRADTGDLVRTLEGHTEAIVELAFSPDSQTLATCGDDSTVRLWRVSDGALLNTLAGGSEHVYAVTFSPDGRFIASGSRERGALVTLWKYWTGARTRGKNLRLWRTRDGELQQALEDHPDDIHSVAFSPDGSLLATSGQSSSVTLFRVEAHEPQSQR